jgi:hypothetical protein
MIVPHWTHLKTVEGAIESTARPYSTCLRKSATSSLVVTEILVAYTGDLLGIR